MLIAATFIYGLIASFVMASINHNRLEARAHPRILLLFGWTLLSFSGVSAVLLVGVAGLRVGGVLAGPMTLNGV